MSVYPKQPTDSIQSYQNPSDVCRNRKKPILKFRWQLEGSQIAGTVSNTKNEVGGLTFSFQTSFKAPVIKTVS
jgi:hypothetical protein